jgi:dienelactone hydrolase
VGEQIGEDLVTLAVLAKKQQSHAQKATESLAAVAADLEKQLTALQNTIPAVRRAAEQGAREASGQAFAGASEAAAKAMDAASQPVIARLETTTQAAAALEGQLRRVVAWFSWRLTARIAAIFGTGVLVLWLVGWGVSWWYQDQREALAAEVEQFRAHAAHLEVVECESHGGPKGGMCLPIKIKALYGEPKDKVLYYPVW